MLLHGLEDALPLPELVNAVRAAAKAFRNNALLAATLVAFLLVRRARGSDEIAKHSLHDFARRCRLDRDEPLRGREIHRAQRCGALLRRENATLVVRIDVQSSVLRSLLRGLRLYRQLYRHCGRAFFCVDGGRPPDDVRREGAKGERSGFAREEQFDHVAFRAHNAQLAWMEPPLTKTGARDLNHALACHLSRRRRRRRRGECARSVGVLCIVGLCVAVDVVGAVAA